MKKEIYKGKAAEAWKREEPENMSDLVAKSYLINRLKKEAQGKEVLDFGCGEGYVSRQISAKAKRVVGFDSSADMIDLALKNDAKRKNESYFVGSINELSKANQEYDIIICSFVLHYFPSKKLEKVFKVLFGRLSKGGGEVWIVAPNPYSLAKHKSSRWLRHEKFGDLKRDDLMEFECPVGKNKIRKVASYFYGLEYYLNAILSNGFRLTEFKDINPSDALLKKFPTLRHEKYLFFFMRVVKN